MFTIMKRSAISTAIKKNTILQEGLRRVKNCDDTFNNVHLTDILTDYSNMLRLSGYDFGYRYNMIKGVLNRSKTLMLELGKSGKPLYRNRFEIVQAKQNNVG